jgi:uncharacterized protein YndB with AHSA1/START domain
VTGDRQVYQIFIRATPREAWKAITDAELTSGYFYGTRAHSKWNKGSSLTYLDSEGKKLVVEGEILEIDEPWRLVHTWHMVSEAALAAEPASRVTWEIEDVGGGTVKVTAIHDRLQSAPVTAKLVQGGWMFVLSGMKSLLETGQGLRLRS